MESELQGRLRNTHLPLTKAMIPLFEAVVNSIQGAEDDAAVTGRSLKEYSIRIRILRVPQAVLALPRNDPMEEIIGFEVEDDGIGFTEENFTSFKTLDSLWKARRGCRGIGRLMWLKVFRQVRVESAYRHNETLMRRDFTFDPFAGVVASDPYANGDRPQTTIVRLGDFEPKFAAAGPKSGRTISTGLLEHCLWYFVRDEGVPTIHVEDGSENFNLDEIFDQHMHGVARAENFILKDESFAITHVKFRSGTRKNNTINYCAAGRLIKEESIEGKIPGLLSTLRDELGSFIYAGYLTSRFLDERVMEQRIGFNIEDEVEGLMSASDISFNDIKTAVLPRIGEFLAMSLAENVTAGRARVQEFVSSTAPRYRPILSYIPENDLIVDPSISDAGLDTLLHKHLFQIEQQLLSEGHQVMKPAPGETEEAYKRRVEEYLEKIADLKRSDLANYVTHRRVVIDLLSKAIQRNPDGDYEREDMIHELIVPMRVTSDDIAFRRQSLWLLDERLAFHDYLASDKQIAQMRITSSNHRTEPDIAVLRVFDNPMLISDNTVGPGASLTVVEIKRPMRTHFQAGESEEKDPILQSLRYLKQLREGSQTSSGRPIPNADKIPGFLYIVADLTPRMREACELHQLHRTADGMGYFGYHPGDKYNAYIQVMSFDGLVQSAKERNRAFFDQLGLPTH